MGVKKIEGSIEAHVYALDNVQGPVRILPLSDIHVGDKHCDLDAVRKIIKRIETEGHTYTILAGDLMNTAIAGGKSDSYGEQLTPQQQIDKCVSLFTPIASKILAIVPGNHEERVSRSVGIDMTQTLAARLGIAERYESTTALVILKFGHKRGLGSGVHKPIVYSLYVSHGHGGGGRKPGSKLGQLDDLAQVIDADIILAGHVHMPALCRQQHFRVSASTGKAVPHEQVLVSLPSFLAYGGYGRRGGYKPTSSKTPEIVLCEHDHQVDVIL